MKELPAAFDLDIYTSANPDLANLPAHKRAEHYTTHGHAEGRTCSRAGTRSAFLSLVSPKASLLEIGPYTAPAFSRPAYNVRYLDAFTSDELRAKAVATGANAETVPEIDYVWRGESYAELIREPVQAIFSSHNIEHQPDFIRHLQQLSAILQPAGRVFLAIPDRRYCFDHFLPDTTFADVLSAYYDRRIRHAAGSVFEHRMLTTHNDAMRHWQDDHGAPPLSLPVSDTTIVAVRETMARIEGTGGYIDTHAWQFTPSSFRHLIEVLGASGFFTLTVERIYPTVRNNNEFYAVLSR